MVSRAPGRDVVKRKDRLLRGCVEAAIEFGLERDALARFLPVANETELAAREQEALDEALETFKNNTRRYEQGASGCECYRSSGVE